MFSFDFWVVVLVVLSLGGHTDTYRTVVYGRGAFELCLPSLGFCYQIRMLRDTISHRTPRLGWPWGEDRRILTVHALYFVWAQLINGFADQHGFGCLIYVFWVDVYVE